MNILMTGGTGFIGTRLVDKLEQSGHHVYILTRSPKQYQDTTNISYISFNYPMKRLPFIHAVINLAGESLFGYWTERKKTNIVNSRLQTTEKLIRLLTSMGTKPDVFISGSAVGYYGMNKNRIFTEKTITPGNDFLAKVCAKWESVAHTAEDLGIRTVYTRFGVVLDKREGALPMMALPFQFGFGGKIGSGEQYLSWIHIHDCVHLLLHALYDERITGPFNITAPKPVQNNSFTYLLAKQLRRPAFFDIPATMMKIALGDMSQLTTDGQYVLPQKALDSGFTFQYNCLEDALEAIYET